MTPREAMGEAIARERGRKTWIDMIDYGAADRLMARLRAHGYLLVSEAELAAALRCLTREQLGDGAQNWGDWSTTERFAAAIFAALSGAAQEQGETG